MGRYYILRDGEVVEEPDYTKWSAWFENTYKGVELIAESRLGGSTVSTRFLALSMTLDKDSPPMVFETTVNGGWLDNQRRGSRHSKRRPPAMRAGSNGSRIRTRKRTSAAGRGMVRRTNYESIMNYE